MSAVEVETMPRVLSMTEHAVFSCYPWEIDIDSKGRWTLDRDRPEDGSNALDLQALAAVVTAAHNWLARFEQADPQT